jgi:hypothetical protein
MANPFTGLFDEAAKQHGLEPDWLSTFARIESGYNPRVRTGSYKGLFQLSDGEFGKHGGQGDIYDPRSNTFAAAAKLRRERDAFEAKYGRKPTAADIYLIHQQGEGGAAAHWSNPNLPAWQNMYSTAEGRQKGPGWAKQAIWGNVPNDVKAKYGSVDNLTSRDFVDLWTQKVARFGGGAPGPGLLPQPPDGMDAATYGAPSPPPSTKMALGGPKPMPFDPATGRYIPEEVLSGYMRRANRQAAPGTGFVGGLGAALLNGVDFEAARGGYQGNQQLGDAAMQRALGSSGIPGVIDALAGGSPEQKKSALSLMLQEKDPNRALERQEKELALKERIMRIQGAQDLFGGGAPSASAGQPPPAASAAPALPSGLPGVTMVGGMPIHTPGFTPGQPTPSPVQGMPMPSPKPDLSPQEKIRQLPKEKQFALRDAFLTKNPKFYEMLDEALDPGKKGREAYDTESAKVIVRDFDKINDAGKSGLSRIGDFDILEAIVKNPKTLQGAGAEGFSMRVRRAADFFGIKSEGLETTQVFQALVNKMALEARNPSGGAGMPGSMSDSDREFLRTMVPSISNTPEGNLAIIGIHRRIAQRDVEVSRMAINYAKNNGGRLDLGFHDALAQWSQANPMWSDKQKAALSGGAQPAAAPGSPAVGAAPAPAPAQDQKQEIMARQARRDAAPPGAIDDEFLREDGRTERRKKGQDGVWRPVSTGEEANLALKGLGEDIASSPAAKFLRWLQSQTGTSANAAQPPIEGAP